MNRGKESYTFMTNATKGPDPKKKKSKAKLFEKFKKQVKRLFGGKAKSLEASVSQILSQTDAIADSHEEERNILRNFVEFGDLEASDIMLPKAEIIALPMNTTLEQIGSVFIKEGHSRIPIYKNTLDEIEGFVHIKDIFNAMHGGTNSKKFKIEDFMRNLMFVPETIKAPDLLAKMKKEQTHIAIVLDEYSGTTGMLTIEDVVEELVGEIQDEYDTYENEGYIRQEEDAYIVDARIQIGELEKVIGVPFVEKGVDVDFDTLGGLVMTHFGYIPSVSEKFVHRSGFEIEVTDATNRRIKQVVLRKAG
jgi:magnesium and cobalt transporter